MPREKKHEKPSVHTTSVNTRLKKIAAMLPHAMTEARSIARKKTSYIRRLHPKKAAKKIDGELSFLEHLLKASKEEREQRIRNRPTITYNTALPIVVKKDAIIAAIKNNPVVIVSGETGSGKTTQIPKLCMDAGLGIDGKIGCTQPRRIAAITVAQRISEELEEPLGTSVGYKIRFTDKTSKNAYIKIMTDGILLAETQKDPYLSEYDTLIVDEAHERSLNIDFILGILKTLLIKRKDLKLIITSATIDTEKFSKAFNNAPVIEVSGRMYPVDVHYMPLTDEDTDDDAPSYVEKAVEAVDFLHHHFPKGDILIFMPTQQDILETREILEGRKYPNVVVMPLFARLTAKEQTNVFSNISGRKIIVATNIAETSITIPGIKYVIDTGLARIPKYTPRTRTTSLRVSPISKSSADQRKGRCGRVENGVCIRLYAEEDYLARPEYTPPEILRANLAEVILKMIALRIGDIWRFPFIDAPAPKSISDGFLLLTELNALGLKKQTSHKTAKPEYQLTSKGAKMAKIPLDPRLSSMLLEAQTNECEKDMLIIASALSIMDPKERPMEKAHLADAAHAGFVHPASDFLGLLNIWNAFHAEWQQRKTRSQMRKYCKDHFLSFKRMREWQDVHTQLKDILYEDKKPSIKKRSEKATENPGGDLLYAAIHKSVLSGFLSNIALKKETNFYTAAKGREVMIFPGSALFNKSKPWIVAAEIVETNRVYARTVAGIDPAWLEPIGRNICQYTYSHARWDKKRGEVVATEQVSLFGLIIASDRKVSYGKIDPEEATAVFIQGALVEAQMDTRFEFMRYNQKLIDDAKDVENRLRRKDILVEDHILFSFYQERLKNTYSIKTLKKKIKEEAGDDFLKMTKEDVFKYVPDQTDLNPYPDTITLGNQELPCEYEFDPGKETDGVTVKIPASVAPSIPTDDMDWLVPGLFKEKITALIKGLPKNYRKQLIPISDTVDIISKEMPKGDGPLLSLLGGFIYQRFNIDIPHDQWPADQLPDYLSMRISVVGKNGREIKSSRDKSILLHADKTNHQRDLLHPIRKKWERTGITTWNFPDLPNTIEFTSSDGRMWTLFPGLCISSDAQKGDADIGLKLFADGKKAIKSHKTGITALYERHFSKDLKFLKKALALPDSYKNKVRRFGGKNKIEKDLYHEVMAQLFSKNIRTQKDFDAHGEKMASELLNRCRMVKGSVLPVLEAYDETQRTLETLRKENRFNASHMGFIEEMLKQTDRLVPIGFISLYSAERLAHLDRYLKALVVRTKRAIVDLEKDRIKSRDVTPHLNHLEQLLASLLPDASDEKREALEGYFWLIEEYKVSVFAQELKTAVTISPKILTQTYAAIQRMA